MQHFYFEISKAIYTNNFPLTSGMPYHICKLLQSHCTFKKENNKDSYSPKSISLISPLGERMKLAARTSRYIISFL